MAEKKISNIVPFGLRMQPKLREKLEDRAKKNNWSLNTEICQRLDESFTKHRFLDQYSDGELIDELVRRWGRENVLIRLGQEDGET